MGETPRRGLSPWASSIPGVRPGTPVAGVTGKALLGYGLAKVGPGLLTFASVPIWVHGVGAGEYATFSLVWAMTLFATCLGVGWIRQAALRTAGDSSGAMGLLPRWVLVAAVAVPIVPVEAWLVATRARAGWPVMVAAGLFCVSSGLYALVLCQAQRDQRSALFAAGETVRAAGGLLAWIALHWFVGAAGAVSILVGTTLGTLGATALLAWRATPLAWRAAPGALRRDRVSGRRLLGFYWHYGWPMSLWLATSAALVYIDRFAIDAFLGATAAGRYAAVADMIVRGMGMLAFPLTMAVHPAAMAAWNAGRHELVKAILGSSARILGAALVVGVATSAIAGPWALGKAMSGQEPSRSLMVVLATGAALWQCALLAHKTLEIAGRTGLMLRLIVVAAVVPAVLDTVLVPVTGVLGAAIGFTLGAACYTLACLLLGPRILREHAAAAPRYPAAVARRSRAPKTPEPATQ